MGIAGSYDELKSLFSYAENLPQAPNSPLRLSELLELPDASPIKVEENILADPALTAGILRTASAAAFGRSRPVTTVREAVMVLGFRSLRSIAVALWTNALVAESKHAKLLSKTRFAQNGVFIGTLAGLMFKNHPAKPDGWTTDEVFAAGLLYNIPIGLLSILAPNTFDDVYTQAESQQRCLHDVFSEQFNGSLKALGADAATIMGLPAMFCQSMAGWECKNAPEESLVVLQILDVAEKTAAQRGLGIHPWEAGIAIEDSLQSIIDLYGDEWEDMIEEARRTSVAGNPIAA